MSPATFGAGLIVGGIIFKVTGESLSDKPEEAWKQINGSEDRIRLICEYLSELRINATKFYNAFQTLRCIFNHILDRLHDTVDDHGKPNWNLFNDDEKLCTRNAALLLGVLYRMCQVKLVIPSMSEAANKVNFLNIESAISQTRGFLANNPTIAALTFSVTVPTKPIPGV
jgi:hypothetical protein